MEVDPAGRSVRLRCTGLRPGYVHEFRLGDLYSRRGEKLAGGRACYTLSRLPAP